MGLREHQGARPCDRPWQGRCPSRPEEEKEMSAENPRPVKFCDVCAQPMTWFGDHWVCVNIKVHDAAANSRRR